MRVGIIGCSNVAIRRFLPALAISSSAHLYRVGSRDRDKAKRIATQFSAPYFGTYEEVLADPKVDLVYVSLPPTMHQEYVELAAKSGKHILCEKPAFLDSEAAIKMVALCKQQQVRLFENYMFLFHPQHEVVKGIVQAGEIGKIRHFTGEFTYPRPPIGDIRLDPKLSGGVMHDSAGYPIAAMLHYFASPITRAFCHQETDLESGVDCLFSSFFAFEGGQCGYALAGFDLHYRSRYVLHGTKGRLEVERAYAVPPEMETVISIEGRDPIRVAPANQFLLALETFCQVLSGKEERDFESELLRRHLALSLARGIETGCGILRPFKKSEKCQGGALNLS